MRLHALRGIAVLAMLMTVLLFLPLGVPVVAALIGLLLGAAVAKAQKRL